MTLCWAPSLSFIHPLSLGADLCLTQLRRSGPRKWGWGRRAAVHGSPCAPHPLCHPSIRLPRTEHRQVGVTREAGEERPASEVCDFRGCETGQREKEEEELIAEEAKTKSDWCKCQRDTCMMLGPEYHL